MGGGGAMASDCRMSVVTVAIWDGRATVDDLLLFLQFLLFVRACVGLRLCALGGLVQYSLKEEEEEEASVETR